MLCRASWAWHNHILRNPGYATQNVEYESGIARLWERDDLPAPLADYVALVKRINPDGQMKLYPGSPLVELELLREQDRMRLFDLPQSMRSTLTVAVGS